MKTARVYYSFKLDWSPKTKEIKIISIICSRIKGWITWQNKHMKIKKISKDILNE